MDKPQASEGRHAVVIQAAPWTCLNACAIVAHSLWQPAPPGLEKDGLDRRQRHPFSMQGRQAGILVDVHSGLPANAEACNSGLPGPVGMDNLLKSHI